MTPTVTTNPTPPKTLTPKLTPTPSAVSAVNSFAAKPKPVKAARKPKTLASANDDYLKILMYSGTGCGKTLTLAKLLEQGLTVLAVCADMGGSGFGSVKHYLRQTNQSYLLENCYFFELQDYSDLDDFFFNPAGFWPEMYEHDIDVLFIDGWSTAQQCHISNKVLDMQALGANPGEAREAGLWHVQADWGAIKTASVSLLDKALRMHNEKTGKTWHKIVTCLESDKAKDNNGETKIGPYIQGAASKLMEPAFDLIFRGRKKKVGDGDKKIMQYFYEMEGSSDRIIAKKRGFEFNVTEPADFGALWISACEQRGIPSGKR